MTRQYHLQVDEGDVAPYVLLPGDPGRVPVIAAQWDEGRHVATSREYVTYTGTYRGVPITCTSTGIGAPSTSIAVEELARCGARVFIRVGTAGTFLDSVKVGDMAIMDGAVRMDGSSRLYAPIEYPAVASHDVVGAAIDAARELGLPYHVGLTRSADSFYAGHSRPGSSFGGYWQSWWREGFDDLARLNVVAAEMEASVIFVLARAWGLRAGGIAVILDQVRHVAGKEADFDPEEQFTHGADQIERLARLANETVRHLAAADRAAEQPPRHAAAALDGAGAARTEDASVADLRGRLRRNADELLVLRDRVRAAGRWPLAERFDHSPEARWGVPEVLAHVTEMLPFWLGEVERILASETEEPFGRIATDTVRLGIIGRDRTVPLPELFDRTAWDVDRLDRRLGELSAADLARTGRHPTRGSMTVDAILRDFVVDHLADHARQLEELLANAG